MIRVSMCVWSRCFITGSNKFPQLLQFPRRSAAVNRMRGQANAFFPCSRGAASDNCGGGIEQDNVAAGAFLSAEDCLDDARIHPRAAAADGSGLRGREPEFLRTDSELPDITPPHFDDGGCGTY